MLAEAKSLGKIAKALGRSKSTISRELKRNATPTYRLYMSHRAHGRAEERKKQANTHQRLKSERIEVYVRSMLKDGWSPELIAGRIELDQPGLSISHEAIYQYIYHPDTEYRQGLIQCLRRAHRKRRNKGIGRRNARPGYPIAFP
jgi:IS30 family transposase